MYHLKQWIFLQKDCGSPQSIWIRKSVSDGSKKRIQETLGYICTEMHESKRENLAKKVMENLGIS